MPVNYLFYKFTWVFFFLVVTDVMKPLTRNYNIMVLDEIQEC